MEPFLEACRASSAAAWSRTFFEGLARLPAGELEGRSLAELGCGNGWISIALARRGRQEARVTPRRRNRS